MYYKFTIFILFFSLLISTAYAQERGGIVVNKYKHRSIDLIWDNTPFNNQVNNPAGTWNATNITWTGRTGFSNLAWIPRANAIFGGTFTIGTAATVTVSGTQQIGNVLFDTIASGNFLLNGGILNLNNTRSIFKNNAFATIASVISGPMADTLYKTGDSTLILNATNTYTGPTIVNTGTLKIGVGTTSGSIVGTSPININTGATMMFDNNNTTANLTIPNPVSNAGILYLKGYNASTALQNSLYILTGNNTAFTGTLQLARSLAWSNTLQSQLGSSLIKVGDRATITFSGATFSNNVIVDNSVEVGWHHDIPGDGVFGAIRLEGTNILNGNITLNNTASVVMGDYTGKNSTIGGNSTGNHTLNGIISGVGDLAMSRYTSWNSGSTQTVDIILNGTTANTYTGKTVVDGQGYVASLRLQKTGGAVAIPANSIIWMGSNTPGQANLRMGDVTTTGSSRSQWDNEIGANVLMQFNNTSSQWMRFDLQGTKQSLSGITAGTLTTQAGAVIQNQNINNFSPANPATLTLTGSGNYIYNGYMRDADNGANATNKLNLVMNGTGKQTLVGGTISHTGITTINSGTITLYNTSANFASPLVVNTGGTVELTGDTKQEFSNSLPLSLSGGTINYTNGGTPFSYVAGFIVTNTGSSVINISPVATPPKSGLFLDGGLKGTGTVTVNNTVAGSGINLRNNNTSFAGTLIINGIASTTAGSGSGIGVGGCTTGLANADITLNGTMELLNVGNGIGWANSSSGAFAMGALNGVGVMVGNYTGNGGTVVTMGSTNINGSFSGVIANGVGNTVHIIKTGTGTQVFSGNNTYTGTTTINAGAMTAGSANAFGTGIIIVNAGGTLNKGGFALPNIILNLGGSVNP